MNFLTMMLALLGVVGLVFAGLAQKKKADEAWAQLASRHFLTPSAKTSKKRRGLEGLLYGLPVKIWQESRSAGKSSTTWTVVEVALPIRAISLTKEHLMSGLFTAIGGQDIELGDPQVDRHLVIKGNEPVVRSLMDRNARQAAMNIDGRTWVKQGTVHFEVQKVGTDVELLQEWLDRASTLALALHEPKLPMVERLARIAAEDVDPDVAQHALRTLLDTVDMRRGKAHAEPCLNSHHPAVRLEAAAYLHRTDLLVALVGPRTPEDLWAQALDALRGHPEPLRQALEQALEHGHFEGLLAALRTIARRKVSGCSKSLLDAGRRANTPTACVAMAGAFAVQGDNAGQAWLIEHLAKQEPVEVRRAAAKALGRVGDLRAVEALVDAQAHVGLTQRALLSDLRGAVTAIQARAGLDDGLAGAVALTDVADQGALSMAAEPLRAEPRGARRHAETEG